MVLEDFYTYTEVDPLGRITIVDANEVKTRCYRDDFGTYIYKKYDKSDFSSNFVHTLEIEQPTAGSNPFARGAWYGVSTSIGVCRNWTNGICIYTYDGKMYLKCFDPVSGNLSDNCNFFIGTRYYVTLTRNHASVTLQIYTDSSRTVLHDTLTSTCNAHDDFEYVYAGSAFPTNSAFNVYVETRDLDLNLKHKVMTLSGNMCSSPCP